MHIRHYFQMALRDCCHSNLTLCLQRRPVTSVYRPRVDIFCDWRYGRTTSEGRNDFGIVSSQCSALPLDRQHKKPAQTLMRVHICKYTPILYQSYWQLASQSKQMLIKSQTELPLITYTLHKKYMYIIWLCDTLLMAVRSFNKTSARCSLSIFSEGKFPFGENPSPHSSFF